MRTVQSSFMHWAKTRPKVKYDLALSGVLNLSFSELDPKPSDLELHGDNAYGYVPLVHALATHCQVPAESVVTVSGGTSMANHLAMAALIEHGDEILVETPAYEPILALADYFGAKVKRFSRRFENNYAIDMDDLAAKLSPGTRLIILTNLHNPSSMLVPENTLREIGALARKVGARVLVDEVYLEAMFDDAPCSSVRFGDEFVATRSLTKGYGLSGLRCGWIIAAPDVAERIRRLDDIFDAVGPHPAERLSVLALAQLEKLKKRAKDVLDENRRAFREFLENSAGLEVVWSDLGTTMFPKLERGEVGPFCARLLEKYDTAVVPGRFFEAPQHMRIGLCCPPDAFRHGLAALGRTLAELAS